MLLLQLAWRNLWRGWRRSAIVLVAITVGLSANALMISWTRGMAFQMADHAIRSYLANVAVHAPGYHADPDVENGLEDGGAAVLSLLGGRAGVHAAPRVVGDGLVQSSRASARARILGVDPEAEAAVSVVAGSIVEGRYLPSKGTPRVARELPPIVIGRAMAERLRLGVEDKVVLHVPGENGLGAFRIRGLYVTASSQFDRTHAFISLPLAQHLFGVDGAVTEVAIALDRESDAVPIQRELATALGSGADVLRWEEREPQLAALLDLMGEMSWILYAAVFVAMAFGIANALLMSVFERTREFGVLRSLGLRARRLVALVLVEAMLLTLLGAVLSAVLGGGLVLWLGATGLDMSLFAEGLRSFGVGAVVYPRLGVEDVVAPLLLALITAFVAALWPAMRVAALRPAEAVRRR